MKNRKREPDSVAEPLLGTIDDAQKMLGPGTGRNQIYNMLNAGALDKVKIGARTMITIASIKRVAKNGFKKSAP